MGEQGEKPSEQEHPTAEQRLIEADKRCRWRLAALARDHIMKLREKAVIGPGMARRVFHEGCLS